MSLIRMLFYSIGGGFGETYIEFRLHVDGNIRLALFNFDTSF